MKSILVSVDASFIGSNFVLYFVKKYPDCHIIDPDKLSYARFQENLEECVSMVNSTSSRAISDAKRRFSRYSRCTIFEASPFRCPKSRQLIHPWGKAYVETDVMGTCNQTCTKRTQRSSMKSDMT